MDKFEVINSKLLHSQALFPSESKNVIVLSAFFDPEEKSSPVYPRNFRLSNESKNLITKCVEALKFGGLFFIYGLPHQLALWGEYLSDYQHDDSKTVFKYWITLNIDEAENAGGILQPNSLGLLMFLKSKANSRSLSTFNLNTSSERVPHFYCSACGQNVKDWGGKKHLMNPKGTALSDVWRDLPRIKIDSHIIPDRILERIYGLTKQEGASYAHIIQTEKAIEVKARESEFANKINTTDWENLSEIKLNEIYQGDCASFTEKVSELYPQGLFDLAFADPPYNLQKKYGQYDDAIADRHYIDWCNEWLAGMIKTLKLGGSLFVLNLPKWAIHHAAFLNKHLEFRNWITWDALSDPRGKLMPAHYALLYYTKPGAKPVFNYSRENGEESVLPPDSPEYCLRASCVRKRKLLGEDKKVELSDVWFDIHRIKHKRDRDAHPCQLPDKLMERIIKLATNRGGTVFDPFCGAGTTAVNAKKLGRNFVTIDVDPAYVEITRRKLESMEQHADLFGVFRLPKQSIKKNKSIVTKKEIELYLQKLARKLGKEPSESDIESDNAEILQKIDLIYPSRREAIKRSRVVLRS